MTAFEEQPAEPARVLIVGAHAMTDAGRPLAEAVAGSGFEVQHCAVEDLERSFRRIQPDVCVIDAIGEGGVSVGSLTRLRENPLFRHVPAIVIGGPEVAEAYAELAMIEHLAPPVAERLLSFRLRSNVDVRRLIEYGRRKSQRLAALLETSHALNSTLDSGTILYFIARKIAEAMDLARCSFIVPDLANGVGRVIACKDDPNIQSLEINLENYPEIIHVLRTSERVIIADVEQDPIMAGVRKFADVFRGQSIMTIPLKFQEEVVGVLQIRKKGQVKGFAPREVEYCELLANAAASALKNAQLYEDIEKHNAELRRQKRELLELSDEMKRKNRELVELQQLKQDFTAMIVHDLRTPLMIVQGVLDLQYYRHSGKPDQRVLLEDGVNVTKKMLQLVTNLLEVSRVEAGELRLDYEWIDPGQFVRQAVEPFKVMAAGRSMELRAQVADGLPEIHADRGGLGQILDNLLSNAFKFTPDGGLVEVSVALHTDDPRTIRIDVRDSGAGIAPEDQSTVFKKFRQGGSGRRQGVGLGLTIVELMTSAHGGRVTLASEVGKGSCFTVLLPMDGKPGGGGR